MSGPIVPPLEVTEVDGSPDGRPITKIVVSNGDLTVSGRTATIDTSGSGMTSFNVAGDTGATQTITNGNTLTIKNAAGGAIKTVGVATDELTIDLTVSGVTAASYTNTSLTVDAQGRITAASSGSGVSFPLEGTDGSAVAPTYSFATQTGTGVYYHSNNKIGFAAGGGLRMTIDGNNHLGDITRIKNGGGSYLFPSYSFTDDDDTGMTRGDSNDIALVTAGLKRLNIESDGAANFWESKIKLNDSYGNDGQVMTSTGSSVAWEDIGAGETAGVVLTDPTVIATGYTKTPTSQRIGGGVLSLAAGELSFSDPFGFPWVSPHTGTIADITVSVTTAQAGRTLEGGIYESDSDGWPSTLLASFDIALDSTGEITQTSFTGTPAVTKGSNYWFIHIADGATSTTARVYARENNVTYGGFQPIMGVHTTGAFGNSIPTGAIIDGETSLPATVTTSAIQTTNKDLLQYLIGW